MPDLGLHASRQRYEHVRRQAEQAVVRYIALGADRGFTSELVLGEDGLVLVYPHLARRVEGVMIQRSASPPLRCTMSFFPATVTFNDRSLRQL